MNKEQEEFIRRNKKLDELCEETQGYGRMQFVNRIANLEEVIDKVINKLGRYADEMVNNGNAYAICVDLLDTLKRYKGDKNDKR